MNTNEIREAFLEFFKSKDHSVVSSSSLVPNNDDTLLFTNAGMVQFKDVFLGQEKLKYSRATTSQKCIRAGGKHNDLENVGYTLRHHTFFEMLGNFSFGDYFKEEAIVFAWEFLTDVLKLDKDKLWITVYKDDDEAKEIWINKIGIDPERIAKLGDKDNFWSMAETGPCGPCSEIFFDHGDKYQGTPPGEDGDEGDRFVEIWNLVFMQFNRDSDGVLHDLPKPSVDTGMGLERIAAVMQGVGSNYETDIFSNLIVESEKMLGNAGDVSHKVIADHLRSSCFLISDDIFPSNEGRGYVLRRILRRAIRHGYKIGADKPFMHKLVKTFVHAMENAYPQLKNDEGRIEKLIKNEETQFLQTLDKGIQILDSTLEAGNKEIISGDLAFKLHDTYGFPFDLTADIAREKGIDIDEKGFKRNMQSQQQMSKASSSFVSKIPTAEDIKETDFIGYEHLSSDSNVIAIWNKNEKVELANEQQEYFIALNQTSIYAESGGQVGDRGIFKSKNAEGSILDCKKSGKVFMHLIKLDKGSLKIDDKIEVNVNKEKREKTEAHHSATHLVHAALKRVLGDHVKQKGSLVDEHKLRFDFSHDESLSDEEISKIENLVNQEILKNSAVITKIMDLEDAKNSGAESLFGEKYEDQVRVLSIGEDDFSLELCGGTHIARTGDLGIFIITSQSSVASGIRRIEALSGPKAQEYLANLKNQTIQLQKLLNAPAEEIEEKVSKLLKENKNLKKGGKKQTVASIKASNSFDVDDFKLVVEEAESDDIKELRPILDERTKNGENSIFILLSSKKDTLTILCSLTKNLQSRISAKDIINKLTSVIDGKGGGRTEFAQGAGKPKDKDKFVSDIPNIIKSLL